MASAKGNHHKELILQQLNSQLHQHIVRLQEVDQRTQLVASPPPLPSYPLARTYSRPGHPDDSPNPQKIMRHVTGGDSGHSGSVQNLRSHGVGAASPTRALAVVGTGRSLIPVVRQGRVFQGGKWRTFQPNYTWHRGGRLKELRTRHVARKYLYMWRERVFGRVPLSVAQAHFSRRLLQQCFYQWYQTYWHNVVEFRLEVTAVAHYHSHILSKTWEAWRLAVIWRRAQQVRLVWVEKYAKERILARVLTAWHRQACGEVPRFHRRQMMFAVAWRAQRLRRTAWLMWKDRWNTAQRWKEVEVKACQYRKRVVQRACLKQWHTALQHVQVARQHANLHLLTMAWTHWRVFIDRRQTQLQMQAHAMAVNKVNVKRHYFTEWRRRLARVQQLRTFESNILRLARRSHKRRVWFHWRCFIEQQRESRFKAISALNLHERHLKQTVFRGLHLLLEHRRRREDLLQLQTRAKRILLLHRAWRRWSLALDAVEEKKIAPQNGAARAHRRRYLMTLAWQQWQEYVTISRVQSEKRHLAEEHFNVCIVQKCFLVWREWASQRQWKAELRSQAVTRHRVTVLGSVFRQWHERSHCSHHERYLHRLAVLHDFEHTRRYWLRQWQRQSLLRRVFQAREIEILQQQRTRQLQKVFRAWLIFTKWRADKPRRESTAIEFHRRRVQEHVFHRWRVFTVSKRQEHERSQLVIRSHYEPRLLKQAFHDWRSHVHALKVGRNAAETMRCEREVRLLKHAFNVWSNEAVLRLRKEREAKRRADEHYHSVLEKKVMLAWSHLCLVQRHRRAHLLSISVQLQQRLRIARLRHAFLYWRQRRDRSAKESRQLQQIHSQWRARRLSQCFHVWTQYTNQRQRKARLRAQAIWMDENRIKLRVWLVWRAHESQCRHEAVQTRRALIFWAHMLQARMWTAWREWHNEQQVQRKREDAAIQRYRSRLLKEGLCHWLSVGLEMSAERREARLHSHTHSSSRGLELALKFALHWRHRVAARRGDQSLPAVSRSVVAVPKICSLPAPQRCHEPSHKIPRPSPQLPDFLYESLSREGLLEDVRKPQAPSQIVSEPVVGGKGEDSFQAVVEEQRNNCSAHHEECHSPPPTVNEEPELEQDALLRASYISELKSLRSEVLAFSALKLRLQHVKDDIVRVSNMLEEQRGILQEQAIHNVSVMQLELELNHLEQQKKHLQLEIRSKSASVPAAQDRARQLMTMLQLASSSVTPPAPSSVRSL